MTKTCGASGGILIGINPDKIDVVESWEGDFSLSIRVCRIIDSWEQVITVVYGPNQRHLLLDFWRELEFIRNIWNLP